MSELSHTDKARLKESYPGLYIVALNFEDMKTLRATEETLRGAWCDAFEEDEDSIRIELELVQQMIKDAES